MEEGLGIRFLKIRWPVSDGSGKRGTTFQQLYERNLMKTRAAVAWEAGKPLEVLEIDLEGPREGEVLIRPYRK